MNDLTLSSGRTERHCFVLSMLRNCSHFAPPAVCADAGEPTSAIKLAAPNENSANRVEIFFI